MFLAGSSAVYADHLAPYSTVCGSRLNAIGEDGIDKVVNLLEVRPDGSGEIFAEMVNSTDQLDDAALISALDGTLNRTIVANMADHLKPREQ